MQGRSQSTPLLSQSGNDGVSPIIGETDDTITIRRPLQYQAINNQPPTDNLGSRTSATMNRYKYYNKLTPHRDSCLIMPNHIVPSEYFLVIPVKQGGQQNSIITIFSLWNTMMGTSLLSIPWALNQAGFAFGITILLLMAAITFYTAYRVIKCHDDFGQPDYEFADICKVYLGNWGYYISIVFSLLSLAGAAAVYWVLMTNFLYNSVLFIYDEASGDYRPNSSNLIPANQSFSSVDTEGIHNHTEVALFDKVWSSTHTTPFFLLVCLVPLINFKSPTFFTKFNALGTVSVLYILVFVIVKSAQAGVNVEFVDPTKDFYIPMFRWTFPALTGMLSLAYFIHNCVVSILRNQRYPENNARDLGLAYTCVAATYMTIGVLFYITFPHSKTDIKDNLLNNFPSSDIMSAIARMFLLFQMITVFPLLLYIFRIQVLDTIFGSIYPSLKHVLGVNACVLVICLLFAVFYPNVGVIIRFSGAACGLVYIFTLPSLVYMVSQKRSGKLTWRIGLFHSFLIVLGVSNLVAQFVIFEET